MTQSLSELRLAYAKLLEDHGANTALLRRREIELEEARREIANAQASAVKMQAEHDSIRDKAGRLEHRAQLAEREMKFLKAMVVSNTKSHQR